MRQVLSVLTLGLSLALAVASPSKPPHHQPKASELIQFPNGTRLENFKVLPNGHLLIGSLSSTEVYTVDPHAQPPTPNTLVTLPSGSSLFGITPLNNKLYAISSGTAAPTPHRYLPGSYRINIISPLSSNPSQILVDSIPIPAPYEFVNGLTYLPNKPHIILAADSYLGEILRINTRTHKITTAWKSPVLGFGDATDGFLIGVNGVRVRDGYLYFTNSRLGTFSRVRIDEDGFPLKGGKDVEVLAILPDFEDGAHLWDDFDLDKEGNAYITAHPAELKKVYVPKGKGKEKGRQEVILGADGQGEGGLLNAPTAAELGEGGKVLYVTNMSGKVVKVEL
ncbi:hypothetical protein B0T16DRAFT_321323 [Cercophora newfieldiana]|uniref:SMP-30/Gluconolactonase/LRE-like region domain-containing protein n=1 Tax=Cercophora newfieldiana TaxID=92897 RepID=A0AA39YJC4_9PEZI|nr:hypothetical protein B0T16DRAFT_321323 [Cercophora newfieldiana]